MENNLLNQDQHKMMHDLGMFSIEGVIFDLKPDLMNFNVMERSDKNYRNYLMWVRDGEINYTSERYFETHPKREEILLVVENILEECAA